MTDSPSGVGVANMHVLDTMTSRDPLLVTRELQLAKAGPPHTGTALAPEKTLADSEANAPSISSASVIDEKQQPHVVKDSSLVGSDSTEAVSQALTIDPDGPRVSMSFRRRLIIMFSLFLIFLLANMDQTIVAVALPTIGSDFGEFSNAAWVGTAYLLTMTAFQPLYGKLSDIFGRLQLLMFALGVFLLGSALCGAAQSMIWLIIARGVMGVGGGGIASLCLVIGSDITTIRERGIFLSLMAMSWSIASIAGPIIGAKLSDDISWRWCFYINLPIGAVSAIISLIFLRIPVERSTWIQKLKRVDFIGSFVVVSALVLILLALSWGGKTYAWNSAVVVTLLVVGLVMLVGFGVLESYVPSEPILHPILFRNLNLAMSFICSLVIGITMFGLVYYIPIFFSMVKNISATKAALHALPSLIPNACFSLIAGGLMTAVGHFRLHMWVGLALTVVGTGILTLMKPDSSIGQQIGYMIVSGAGLGITLAPSIVLGQISVEPSLTAVATALMVFARTFGGILGLAICDTVLANSVGPKLAAIAAKYPESSVPILTSQNNAKVLWESNISSS
ncbi:hypothetical protein EV182_003870, partial [Spiromyces aspiralis]